MGYYDDIKLELQNLITDFNSSKKYIDKAFSELEEQRQVIEEQKKIVKQMAKERQIGFPILAEAYDDFFKLQDKQLVDFLRFKSRPALQASKIVSEISKVRRKAEKEKRIIQYIIDYYENIAPFLIDLKEEIADITEEERELLAEYTEEELEDRVTNYLTKAEYRKLSTTEKNQLALDRFWKRPKSKWLIGRLYERYVGYIYELKGFDVEYVGIFKGYEDLGRDLICQKGKNIIVIQCKNWSKFKTIYEKHIFQFFGTVFKYKDENPKKKVKAEFYCTTKFSDLTRRFAKELGIKLFENHKFDQKYPCIKCNISRVDGEKIYHLPFDQQYDNTKIEIEKGEFYASTVKEAEDKGFRRAWRWKGTKED